MSLQSKFVWMNGEMVAFEKATVPILSQTLHYGYGVFEGIRMYRRTDGEQHIFRLREHIERLLESAHILGIEVDTNAETLMQACKDVLVANELDEGYLRPLIYLGAESMGLGSLNNSVNIAIPAWKWGAYLGDEGLRNGIRCQISSFSRLHVNVNMVKGKICGQYVNSVIAKRMAMASGFDEAIMLDTQGYVSECTGENLFMVKKGVIYTAPYGSSILGGITRDTVIQLAHDLNVRVVERLFTRDELYTADEIFLCGTAAEVTPVREVDHRRIGSGRPGPISTRIANTFFGVVRGDLTPHKEWREPLK